MRQEFQVNQLVDEYSNIDQILATIKVACDRKMRELPENSKVVELHTTAVIETHELIAMVDHAKPVQHEEELAQLIDFLQRENVRSYLEIGVERGGTFRRVMMSLPEGSKGVAVDLPIFAVDEFSRRVFFDVISRLHKSGRQVNFITASSELPEVVEEVRGRGPYDAVLIDGDHSYDAVKRDFENYGPMAKFVIFHDIKSESAAIDVQRFWDEIKWGYMHMEIVHTGGAYMGLGILYNHKRAK